MIQYNMPPRRARPPRACGGRWCRTCAPVSVRLFIITITSIIQPIYIYIYIYTYVLLQYAQTDMASSLAPVSC